MENGAYPTNWNFCVSAKWYAESATEFKWASSGSVLYMNEVECAYDGTTEIEAWGTTPAYYWPKQGYLSFHAFSPSSIASATEFDATDGGVKIGSAASLYAFNPKFK